MRSPQQRKAFFAKAKERGKGAGATVAAGAAMYGVRRFPVAIKDATKDEYLSNIAHFKKNPKAYSAMGAGAKLRVNRIAKGVKHALSIVRRVAV